MASSPITSWKIDGETVETVSLFLRAPKSLQMVTVAIKLKDAFSLDNLDMNQDINLDINQAMNNLDSVLKIETLLCQQRSI